MSPVTRADLSIVYSGPVDFSIAFLTLQLYYHGLATLSLSSQACYQVEPFPTQLVMSKITKTQVGIHLYKWSHQKNTSWH